MEFLKSIPIENCKIYLPWTTAPNGCFLQVRETSKRSPRIGLRCEVPNSSKAPQPCFLYLDGEENGRWKALNASLAAIDVSDQIEICATDPAPYAHYDSQKIGFLYWHQDGAIFLWTANGDSGAFVCIKPSEIYGVGTLHYELDLRKLYELGKASTNPIDPK